MKNACFNNSWFVFMLIAAINADFLSALWSSSFSQIVACDNNIGREYDKGNYMLFNADVTNILSVMYICAVLFVTNIREKYAIFFKNCASDANYFFFLCTDDKIIWPMLSTRFRPKFHCSLHDVYILYSFEWKFVFKLSYFLSSCALKFYNNFLY